MPTKPLEFDPKHRFWALATNGDLYKIDPDTVSVTRPNGSYFPINISVHHYGQESAEVRAHTIFAVIVDRLALSVFIDTKELIKTISALTILQSIADEETE